MTELYATRANSLFTVLILLDLSAETVDHQTLLSTFKGLIISGSALCLTGLSYQMTWKGSLSDPWSITTGVPQVSVLGPGLLQLSPCWSPCVCYQTSATNPAAWLVFNHPTTLAPCCYLNPLQNSMAGHPITQDSVVVYLSQGSSLFCLNSGGMSSPT